MADSPRSLQAAFSERVLPHTGLGSKHAVNGWCEHLIYIRYQQSTTLSLCYVNEEPLPI